MTTWVDDFTVDHFASGDYTLLGGTGPPAVGGGHALVATALEWLDPRLTATAIDATIRVREGSQIYLLAVGLIDANGGNGVLAGVIPPSNVWQLVSTPGGSQNVSAPFVLPAGDWTLHLSITAEAIHASDGQGQTLDLTLAPENAAGLAAATDLSPFGAAYSASLLGTAGAVVDLTTWTYSTEGPAPGPGPGGDPGLIALTGVSVGVVR